MNGGNDLANAMDAFEELGIPQDILVLLFREVISRNLVDQADDPFWLEYYEQAREELESYGSGTSESRDKGGRSYWDLTENLIHNVHPFLGADILDSYEDISMILDASAKEMNERALDTETVREVFSGISDMETRASGRA